MREIALRRALHRRAEEGPLIRPDRETECAADPGRQDHQRARRRHGEPDMAPMAPVGNRKPARQPDGEDPRHHHDETDGRSVEIALGKGKRRAALGRDRDREVRQGRQPDQESHDPEGEGGRSPPPSPGSPEEESADRKPGRDSQRPGTVRQGKVVKDPQIHRPDEEREIAQESAPPGPEQAPSPRHRLQAAGRLGAQEPETDPNKERQNGQAGEQRD